MSHSSRRITCVFDIKQPKSTQYESKVQFDEIYRLVPIGRSIGIDLNIFDGIFTVNFLPLRTIISKNDKLIEKYRLLISFL